MKYVYTDIVFLVVFTVLTSLMFGSQLERDVKQRIEWRNRKRTNDKGEE